MTSASEETKSASRSAVFKSVKKMSQAVPLFHKKQIIYNNHNHNTNTNGLTSNNTEQALAELTSEVVLIILYFLTRIFDTITNKFRI